MATTRPGSYGRQQIGCAMPEVERTMSATPSPSDRSANTSSFRAIALELCDRPEHVEHQPSDRLTQIYGRIEHNKARATPRDFRLQQNCMLQTPRESVELAHNEGVAFTQLRIVACRANFPAWALKVKSMPSIRTLEEWVSDCGCETVTGEWVEPDGIGRDGAPAWLRTLRMI